MPIVTFHIAEDQYSDEQLQGLLSASARVYAHVLDSPMDRIRAFICEHRPQHCLVAGEFIVDGAPVAPFFEFILFAGRPLKQRQTLLASFTDLIVEHLGAQRALIRGRAMEVQPEDWGIGGVPASELRTQEVRDRAEAAK